MAAGWRSKKKTRTERIPISTADELFNRFVDGIAKANANRKFAFFVEEAIVYGSYMRRDKATVGDIDIALSFAMKTETKLNRRIQYYMRREGVDWKGGYDKAIGEVSDSIIRSKHFHQAAIDHVKRRLPFRVVYEMPDRERYARLASYTDNWNSIEHLHEFVEEAERKRARATRKGKSASV